MEIFHSFVRRCPGCQNEVLGDAVEFWHKPRCVCPDFKPDKEFGWFFWRDNGEDPCGPFESQTLATIAGATGEVKTA